MRKDLMTFFLFLLTILVNGGKLKLVNSSLTGVGVKYTKTNLNVRHLDDFTFNDGLVIYNDSNTLTNAVQRFLPSFEALNTTSSDDRSRPLPVKMIIIGPAATLSIIIFLCIAYYFHNSQLNKKAKRLSMALTIRSSFGLDDKGDNPDIASVAQYNHVPEEELDFNCDKLSPRRSSQPPLSSPRSFNAVSSVDMDQAILTLSSPRRHSTFIL
ncbi:hypothetical protein ACF0H5_015452 [Mactra antiquata]